MSSYCCLRCGYETLDKAHLKRHYNRKNICNPKLLDISIEDCLNNIKKKDNKVCEYCNKKFTRKFDVKRHQIKCSDKKYKERIKKLEEENELLKKIQGSNNNITNNIDNSVTNHNNIIVIKFDVGNLSTRIPDAEKLKCFRDKTYQAPPIEDFLKTIHFNPKYPEYHNIFKSDMNREWISIFDGDKLVKQPDTFVDDIIEKIEKEIEYLIENNGDYKEYYQGLRTHFNMMKKDEEYKESLVKGVKLLIHNNKNVPTGTLKLLGVM